MDEVTLYRLILGYLKRLPGAMKEMTGKDGKPKISCIYTPHSLRATTATLLLDGVLTRPIALVFSTQSLMLISTQSHLNV